MRRGVVVVWLLCCVVSWCSLRDNDISAEGVAAVAAALVHVPQLLELQCVALQLGPMCFRASLLMPVVVVEGQVVVTGCEAGVAAVACLCVVV